MYSLQLTIWNNLVNMGLINRNRVQTARHCKRSQTFCIQKARESQQRLSLIETDCLIKEGRLCAHLFIGGVSIGLKDTHEVHGLATIRQSEVYGHQKRSRGVCDHWQVRRDVNFSFGSDECFQGCESECTGCRLLLLLVLEVRATAHIEPAPHKNRSL